MSDESRTENVLKLDDVELAALLGVMPILRFFDYEHLPSHLASVSRGFHNVAWTGVLRTARWDGGAVSFDHPQEVAAGLRKLLEAKDCFVRASL